MAAATLFTDSSAMSPMQAQTFAIFQRNEVSVDVVATSEVSVSLTLDPSKIWSRDLIGDELEALKARNGAL